MISRLEQRFDSIETCLGARAGRSEVMLMMSKIDGWRLRLALNKPPKVSIGVPQELRTLRTCTMTNGRLAREATHLVTPPPCLNGIKVPRCSERPILNTRGDSGLAIVFFCGLTTALDERKRGSSNIVGCTCNCVCASVRVCAYPLRFPWPPIQSQA